ncbi:MAG: C40 family peptidase [Chitinophagaceae bacterium]|nr:C40 family peptidase [Chitinophagaceae bacterium]
MRYLIFLLGISVFVASCSSTRHAARSGGGNAGSQSAGANPRFLDNISINGSAAPSNTNEQLPAIPELRSNPRIFFIPAFNIEYGEPLQFKYAIKMNVEVERLANAELYKFIENWWATPYRMGGSTKKGVDCSAFTQTLLSVIYNIQVPRTASEQKQYCMPVDPEQLKEGDLVFFNTKGRGISHVGIYLHDHKFVHAASSNGVMISSLEENYWSKKYAGAGRVVDEKITSNVSLSR